MGFVTIIRNGWLQERVHVVSHGEYYSNRPPMGRVVLFAKNKKEPHNNNNKSKNKKSTFLDTDRILDRIREDFDDDTNNGIQNWPGELRRTREFNRNKFYGGVVIGIIALVGYLLEVASGFREFGQ